MNKVQQIHIDDNGFRLTEREQKILQNSWAEDFATYIFPNLAEEPFSVLFSENDASKPNAPINVILGLLILKEQFGLTDEELMHELLFNYQYQYALHTTSFREQPINDNTLRRFRNRVSEYEARTGEDLIKAVFDALAGKLSGVMGIDPALKRMDSAMIASGCRRLSRLGIMHETVRLAARELKGCNAAPEACGKYAGDEKDVGYRLKREGVAAKMEELLKDALAIIDGWPSGLRGSGALAALRRMVDDQSRMDGEGRALKSGGEISPESMQTPHEQDATYRKKSGRDNVGFVGNIVEACDGAKNLITGYDLQKNTYSDMKFGEDVIGEMPDGGGRTKTLVADGAYGSVDIIGAAGAKGVEMAATSLAGGLRGDFEAGFEIDGEGRIVKCPAGHQPIKTLRSKKHYKAHFDSVTCRGCPHCERCPGVFLDCAALISFSKTALEKARYAQKLATERYIELSKKRNGVEGVPSVLRRRYAVDKMREKGLVRKRQRYGIKLMAINVSRLSKWLSEQDICAEKCMTNSKNNNILQGITAKTFCKFIELMLSSKNVFFQALLAA